MTNSAWTASTTTYWWSDLTEGPPALPGRQLLLCVAAPSRWKQRQKRIRGLRRSSSSFNEDTTETNRFRNDRTKCHRNKVSDRWTGASLPSSQLFNCFFSNESKFTLSRRLLSEWGVSNIWVAFQWPSTSSKAAQTLSRPWPFHQPPAEILKRPKEQA